MNLSDFDYELPPERIAQRPPAERDAARMLLLDRRTGEREDREFRALPELLRGNELLVINNARVFPARLFGRRAGIHAQHLGQSNPARCEFLQTAIEVLLVRQVASDTWEALVRPRRKLPTGEQIVFGEGELEAQVEGRGQFGLRILRFRSKGNFHELLGRLGHIPLPPYIKRVDEATRSRTLPDCLCAGGSGRRGANSGPALYPRDLEAAPRTGNRNRGDHSRRGTGDFRTDSHRMFGRARYPQGKLRDLRVSRGSDRAGPAGPPPHSGDWNHGGAGA